MSRDDELLAKILIGGKHIEEAALERARKLLQTKHRHADLASVLLSYKLIEKEKLALAQRMAKMTKATPPKGNAPGTPPPTAAAPADTTVPTDEIELAGRKTPLMAPKLDPARWKRAQDRTHFGQYEVVEKIAKGGMGIVFKVRHPGLDRFFALKVLAQGEDADEEVLERFRREAKTAARLDHPSIVRVHDAGTEDGFPYIVMDLVVGDSLARIVKDEGVSPRKSALIARSIARALAHAHDQGIIHRDVKPDNVLIDRATGDARLSDFGIVKDLAGDGDARLTKTGLTLGSPCYMSPEQAAGRHKDVGAWSDVYSLGATLYEMLTSRPPFDGDSIHEIMTRVVREEPVRPRKINPSVNPQLEAVCMKALEKDLPRRYRTATAFAEDLDRYLDGKHVIARPAGLGTRVWRVVRRHRAPAFLILVLLGVVGAAVGNAIAKESQARRNRAIEIEQTLQAAEASLLLAAKPDAPEIETRRAYRDAMKAFDRVLEWSPASTRAREGKVKAILGLADRLLERREAGFAEFVLDQAEGLADPAQIGSRLELARKSEWAQKADAAELRGDLDEALRLNREGLRALREAGLSGEVLDRKVRELERELAKRKHDDEVKGLIESAERNESTGDLAIALETFQHALQLAPETEGLRARVAIIEGRVRRQIEDGLDQVLSERERAKVTLPAGSVSRPDLTNQLDQCDALVRSAREKAQAGDFGAALDSTHRAKDAAHAALDVASTLAAREDARAAQKSVQLLESSKFAASELLEAAEHLDAGESGLAAGEYARARGEFVQAAKIFRLASNTGATKQAVAAARDAAEAARSAAEPDLPQGLTLRAVRDALAAEADAKRDETGGNLARARELYGKAAVHWAQAREQAPDARNALVAREHARARKLEADAELGSEYDPDDSTTAQRAMDDGDAALAREEFARATERYGQAEYRWKQSAAKSAPISRPRRRIEAIRKTTEESRSRATAAGKADTKRFDEAMKFFNLGEDAERRRYWHGAEDYYGRARQLFDALAAPPEGG